MKDDESAFVLLYGKWVLEKNCGTRQVEQGTFVHASARGIDRKAREEIQITLVQYFGVVYSYRIILLT